eukprot:scaffold557_cov89-Skeletonema_dohrnii-CCMP3373.AAC.2
MRKQNVLRRLTSEHKKNETSRKDFHSRIGIIAYYCLHSVVVANIIGGDTFRCCRLSLHTLLGYCAASRHHRASISPPHAIRNVAIIVQNLAPSKYITYPPLFPRPCLLFPHHEWWMQIFGRWWARFKLGCLRTHNGGDCPFCL